MNPLALITNGRLGGEITYNPKVTSELIGTIITESDNLIGIVDNSSILYGILEE